MRSNPSSPGTRDGWARGLALASFLCPCAAWLSQLTCTATVPTSAGQATLYLVLAVVQGILILAGLVLSIVSLAIGRGRTGTARAAAISGLLLSVGTLVLIGGVAMALH